MSGSAGHAGAARIPAAARLSPLEYAVLGLLADRPAHGYDLHRTFAPGGDLGEVAGTEQPTVYAALKALAARGLIAGEEVRAGARPPRTVYALTRRGRLALDRWLDAPVHRLREVRLDFLLKVFFARRRGPARVLALVNAQIAACEQYREALRERAQRLRADGFAYLVAESRLSAADGTLAWLGAYRARLLAAPGAPLRALPPR